MAYVDPLVSEGVRHYLEASYRLLTGSAEGRRFLHLAAPIPGLAVHGYTTADDMDALVRSLDPGDGRGGSAVSGPTAAGARLDYGPGVDILSPPHRLEMPEQRTPPGPGRCAPRSPQV